MKKLSPAFLLVPLLALSLSSLSAAKKPPTTSAEKPNIIYILADDLGIGNVSCYGADNFKTPNVDALAKSGLQFEHCYAAPLCGPSRALLMTGRYAYNTGMTSNKSASLLKPDKEIMMPTVLKPAGYVTAQCGKWGQLPLQPGDWGFDEYLRFKSSGKYWNTQVGNKTYTLNGKEVPLRDGEYLPDRMHNFVVDFITRHKDQPFYVYYSMSHVHAQVPHAELVNGELPQMMLTPDSAPGTTDQFKLFQDNVTYMDKLVGKLIAELDRLKLRKNTLIIFSGDNGTATPFYLRSTIHGKALSGHKATMEECGALVPCIANWPGKVAAGNDSKALINLCDFFPTLAEVAGAKLPAGVKIDGQGFAPQLFGKSDVWPRSWIFVELGRHWFDRETDWKLNEESKLFDMRDAPYSEPLVPADTKDDAAIAARKRLQAVLDQLYPAGGIVDADDGSGKKAKKKAKKAKKGDDADMTNSGNTNAADQ